MDARILRDAGFEHPDTKAWAERIRKGLKPGQSDAFLSPSFDGISVAALSSPAREANAAGRAAPAAWRIVQRVDDPNLERAIAQVKADIDGGATGIALVFEGAPNAGGYGLPASAEATSAIVETIPLDRVHVRIDTHPNSRLSADWMMAALQRKRPDISKLSLSFGIDPAALYAGTGRLRMSIGALQASMPQSLAGFFAFNIPGVLLEADGRVYHNAGATAAQELGAMLAAAVSHLAMFEAARQPLVYAAPHIGFALSVDQDQFLSIAKVRALRLLWARLQEACGIEPSPAIIHAETSLRMLTRKDAETNILRNTIAAFAAGVGGADTVSIVPHSAMHGLPDPLARRIARNCQTILISESGLDFVQDPSSGSGSIEDLTERLAEAAWAEFQAIEHEGGLFASLGNGAFQGRVRQAHDQRMKAYVSGDEVLVGSTLHPAKSERPVAVLKAETSPMPDDGSVFCEQMPLRAIEASLEAGQ